MSHMLFGFALLKLKFLILDERRSRSKRVRRLLDFAVLILFLEKTTFFPVNYNIYSIVQLVHNNLRVKKFILLDHFE